MSNEIAFAWVGFGGLPQESALVADGSVHRADVSALKAEALNEMARGLATATTLEECRGLALVAFRKMLDIIYPEEDKT